ncbi:hypothetical protein A2U01_0053512, partial [Trifolium medium]|nr:hypothetical protein [Trifolium medium]
MESPTSYIESHVVPIIKQICRMLKFDTEDLLDQVDDFTEFVNALKDYSWRLIKKESFFLERVLRFQKELASDAPFVNFVEEQEWCHKEVVTSLFDQTSVLKESMRVQEEIISISLSEEDLIEGRIET